MTRHSCGTEAIPIRFDGKPVRANPANVRKSSVREVMWCPECDVAFTPEPERESYPDHTEPRRDTD